MFLSIILIKLLMIVSIFQCRGFMRQVCLTNVISLLRISFSISITIPMMITMIL